MRVVPRASHKTPPQTGTKSLQSPDSRNAMPCVVGGLLRGLPELTLLVKAAAGIATIELVDDRLAVVSRVLACRPDVLVIPPFDGAHVSTAPLVLRARREAPSVGVLIVSSHPAGAGQPMLRAVRAGAHVITSPTAAELQRALMNLLEPKLAAQ